MSYEFRFPDIGEGLTEGKILEFKVEPGAEVVAGDILAIVETDKVVAEIASPRSGVVVRFGSAVGERIGVGETLAFIDLADGADDEDGDAIAAGTARANGGHEFQALVGTLDAAPSSLPASDELDAPEGTAASAEPAPLAGGTGAPVGAGDDGAGRPYEGAPAPEGGGNRDHARGGAEPLVTPAARRLARDLGVDLARITPSSAGARIQREDVESAAASTGAAAPLAPDLAHPGRSDFAFPLIDDPLVTPSHLPLGQTVELTILRKTIAHTMESSRKIPTATIFDMGVVDDLVELRAKVNRGRDLRVSFQPFFMKALATALRRYPVLNAHFNPVSEELTVFKDINIGVAVNTEAGLMLPVIHNVENKTIRQIDTEMKDMVERAKGRQISIKSLRGGTFSLTNFGPFGGLFASAMIYPPQVAIIGAGRIHQAPMVVDGEVRAAWVLPVSLAFDHRVVDGVPAAEFASYFLELLRGPQELFVSM
ncbi:MAG: dihydrolipoamide acetyltransferase family protein [Spirochaetaceae bacterium]|nr:dihydrolipoamide acetyltransferase family protein [Spirochaetaceae bacterium]